MPVIGVNESKDFFYIQNEQLAYASSINEVLKLYESAFDYIELAGPCNLAPGIKATAEWVKNVAQSDNLFYGVLLIVTDGEVADMDATISALVDASTLPMSILIVGVGNKKFDDLNVLDGDAKRPKDKKGRTVARDIVQFSEYSKTISKGLVAFSEDLLAELPSQIVEYFKMKNIKPVGTA